MRKAILLACVGVAVLGTLGNLATAGDIVWREDLRAAVAESQQTGKPLLIDFTAEWCGYCKKLKKSFEDEQVAKHLESCFIPVVIDVDRDPELMQAAGVSAMPTLLVVAPDMRIVKRIEGYRPAPRLRTELEEICVANHETTGDKKEPIVQAGGEEAPAEPGAAAADMSKFAFDGCCLVTLLEEQKIKPGNPVFSATFRERTLCFASVEQFRKFIDSPTKYWPMFDGNCPVAAKRGVQTAGKPASGAIYEGQLVFFADTSVREEFAKTPQRFIPQQ